jgi:cephalosporin-C deacetylase-like acetyl esterase
MRWLLTVTVAALAVPAYAGENDAEKLFRQMETKIHKAKTLQVRFDVMGGKKTSGRPVRPASMPT